MARFTVRTGVKSFAAVVCSTAALSGAAVTLASAAQADAVAYLVNVTVPPGYNFPNADVALAYGRGICDKVRTDAGYVEILRDIKSDFHTSDEFQASYLIIQAVNELCPAQIWQLRNSAANYRPAAS